MAFIRKHKLLEEQFFQVLTEHDNMLLDYNSIIYGRNHRLPSFGNPPKPIKFVVKIVDNINQLFVTTAESPGCFFIKGSVKIYCTNPVYEQIILKYEEYRRLSVTYDEECELFEDIRIENNEFVVKNERYRIHSIEDIDIDEFKKKIHFISYNEVIKLYSVSVVGMQPGTFLGCVNYRLIFGNGSVLYYLTSYSVNTRFSCESAKIECDYIIINRKASIKENQLRLFSDLLRNFCIRMDDSVDNTLVIPLPLETLFIEILLHTLSVVHSYNIPIFVVSPLYKKVELLVNIQSEWLNSTVCMSEEPFPIREYHQLYHIDRFNHDYREASGRNNKIIFCSDLLYRYKNKVNIFKKQLDILINHKSNDNFNRKDNYNFNLSDESPGSKGKSVLDNMNEISDEYLAKLDKKYNSNKFYDIVGCNIKIESSNDEILALTNAVIISDDTFFFKSSADYVDMIMDGSLFNIKDKLFVFGDFLFTDKFSDNQFKIYIKKKHSLLKKLLEKRNYIVIGNSIIFPKERLKWNIINNYKIEYESF